MAVAEYTMAQLIHDSGIWGCRVRSPAWILTRLPDRIVGGFMAPLSFPTPQPEFLWE